MDRQPGLRPILRTFNLMFTGGRVADQELSEHLLTVLSSRPLSLQERERGRARGEKKLMVKNIKYPILRCRQGPKGGLRASLPRRMALF
jgi:hypothetical protein